MKIEPPEMLAAIYVLLNLTAGAVFALDKRRAQKNRWRISETTLLLFAAVGPFGAWCSMQIFRHKTGRIKFWLVPVFLVLHLVLIFWSVPLILK